jgi:hypothetical protein
MRKIGFGLLIVFLLCVGFNTCAKAQSNENAQSKLIGKWALADEDEWRFEFASASLSINNDKVQGVEYKIENGAIKITWLGTAWVVADSFEFIDNDTLKLTGGNAEGTYKRIK